MTKTGGSVVQSVENAIGPKDKRSSNNKSKDRNTTDSGPSGPNTDGGADSKATGTRQEGGSGGLLDSIVSGAVTGLAPGLDALKSGAALSQDAARSGLSISRNVLQSGLDFGTNVATGTADLTGTVLGGVINAAAETSGPVFEPIGSGLRVIHALDNLGQGADAINGLAVGCIKQIHTSTTKALNMGGRIPTFFDPDADGIVSIPDTARGLALLGLDDKTAKYASWLLHVAFSYPTSDRWWPKFNTRLPIHVSRMGRTKWGRNWGNFERIKWVRELAIDKFFADDRETKSLSDRWRQVRQIFGVLLFIFEWGTTWPYLWDSLPVQAIPFHEDFGKVVRKAIFPTIFSNYMRARDAETTNPSSKNKATTSQKKKAPAP